MPEQSGSNSNSEKWGLVTMGAGIGIITVAGAAAEILSRQANASQHTGVESLAPIIQRPDQESIDLWNPVVLSMAVGAAITAVGIDMYCRWWPFRNWPKNPADPTKPTS